MRQKRARGWRAQLTLLMGAGLAVALLHATAFPSGGRLVAVTAGTTPATAAPAAAATQAVENLAGVAVGAHPMSETPALSGSGDIGVTDQTTYSGPDRTPPASQSAVYSSRSITFVGGVGYTSQESLDIYVPNGPGPHPTVVLIRGGPSGDGGRAYLDSFASGLAYAGLLVFNADYRDSAGDGGGSPAAFRDVACAVRFARANAERYNGDDSLVTLVGHSLGGWVGSVVALDDKEFSGGCAADGSGRPDAFVGLAGNYDLSAGGGTGRDLNVFFGGPAATTAVARAASDPFAYANGSKIPVRLVAGTADGTVNPSATIKLNTMLTARGWNVGLTFVPDATHMSILWSSYGGGSFGAIFSAISAARSLADATNPVKGRTAQ